MLYFTNWVTSNLMCTSCQLCSNYHIILNLLEFRKNMMKSQEFKILLICRFFKSSTFWNVSVSVGVMKLIPFTIYLATHLHCILGKQRRLIFCRWNQNAAWWWTTFNIFIHFPWFSLYLAKIMKNVKIDKNLSWCWDNFSITRKSLLHLIANN